METPPAFAGGRSRPIWRVRPVLIRGLKEAVKNGFFKVHRRKPWSLGERLRNLTPDFMDVRRRNCSIAR
ncbi:hypothetical protein, partial [Burkholderia mallei]